ncbi:hypothetical protein [Flavobacterium pectinovorum]|uniref:Lipoprotein n=1 Tax=Flavobacterium pectinovorum TaxID=29533 RepID=A0A502ELP8_9FLAO|nr:hypothetical protein [Flavobacterium pectinovorum]TPG38387.1 hypothetical protein EAH81_15760 [Flavobacterium pectinovorum]
MNKIKLAIFTLSILAIVSCKSNEENQVNNIATDSISVENLDPSNDDIEHDNSLPKYKTIKEMFEASYDFSEEVGTLKFISLEESKLHVQVSKPIFEGDLKNIIAEQVKRDIVYVAFQTFAQTEINALTITSVPNSNDKPNKYFDIYKKTVKVNRENALLILKKYLDTNNFSILYENQNRLWVPSKQFSVLKFEKLNEVYSMIEN